eukprot:PhF_6_TR42634/c0_g1_i3/m.64122
MDPTRKVLSIFSSLKRRLPCGVSTIELLDEDNIFQWFVRLSYDETSAVPSVTLRVCFSQEGVNRVPDVFVIQPRLVAPFIHRGALCALEVGVTSWVLSEEQVGFLFTSLHSTLDVSQRTDMTLDTSLPSYTKEEHEHGLRHVMRAHPTFYRPPPPPVYAGPPRPPPPELTLTDIPTVCTDAASFQAALNTSRRIVIAKGVQIVMEGIRFHQQHDVVVCGEGGAEGRILLSPRVALEGEEEGKVVHAFILNGAGHVKFENIAIEGPGGIHVTESCFVEFSQCSLSNVNIVCEMNGRVAGHKSSLFGYSTVSLEHHSKFSWTESVVRGTDLNEKPSGERHYFNVCDLGAVLIFDKCPVMTFSGSTSPIFCANGGHIQMTDCPFIQSSNAINSFCITLMHNTEQVHIKRCAFVGQGSTGFVMASAFTEVVMEDVSMTCVNSNSAASHHALLAEHGAGLDCRKCTFQDFPNAITVVEARVKLTNSKIEKCGIGICGASHARVTLDRCVIKAKDIGVTFFRKSIVDIVDCEMSSKRICVQVNSAALIRFTGKCTLKAQEICAIEAQESSQV